MNLREEELSSEKVFEGKIIDVEVREITLPNDQTATREVVLHRPFSAVIAINDKQQMLLVEQWREPIKQISFEIPAGMIDETDASPLDAMKRELNEEGGYRADFWEELAQYYISPGFTNEYCHLFYCDTLTKLEEKKSLDEDEFLETHWFNLEELKQMIAEGKINDGKTLYAITLWENMLHSGK
ncbi:MAG: NUDIX hydrolase [Lactobacillus sp.]|nr:NUDIX hydrolase [Lactobacillus sp.]